MKIKNNTQKNIDHIVGDGEISHNIDAIMLDWCNSKSDIVVLTNGDILSSDPISSDVNECKKHMSYHGLKHGSIIKTPASTIRELKTNSIKNIKKDEISKSHNQLRQLIHNAASMNASDIHMIINQKNNQAEIKFRVNGQLIPYTIWDSETGVKVHSVAYNHLSTNKQDSFSMSLPQDMSFTENFESLGNIRIRSSNIGTKEGGCKIVYRLLSIGKFRAPTLEKLGYAVDQQELLKEIKNIGSGLVLFCGETGSGKTTSLASVLSEIDPRKSTYSIEDPVEIYIDNVEQCPIDTRNDKKNFAHYLRALLRSDPDVIMVGEIRDTETAKVSIQGALTGHLIVSTLHTKHAVNAIMRLNELGVPAANLATPGMLKMIIAQQLHPQLCKKCSRSLTKDEKANLSDQYSQEELSTIKTVSINKSCPNCNGTGITNRKVYAEVIKLDKTGREFIAKMDIRGWEKYLEKNNFMNIDKRIKKDIISGEIDVFSLKSSEKNEKNEFIY